MIKNIGKILYILLLVAIFFPIFIYIKLNPYAFTYSPDGNSLPFDYSLPPVKTCGVMNCTLTNIPPSKDDMWIHRDTSALGVYCHFVYMNQLLLSVIIIVGGILFNRKKIWRLLQHGKNA